MSQPELFINSDNSIIIEFDDAISLKLTRYILGVKLSIEKAKLEGFVEAVPAYDSLLILFDAETFHPERHWQQLHSIVKTAQPIDNRDSQRYVIPVCYDLEVAPDLPFVADHAGLTTDDVIQLHSEQDYPVYMLGFLPGFLYLGELKSQLHCPRRSAPRAKIEAGSVAIGGSQTGIYPIDSPGGWHIIGKTPMKMLDVSASNPAIAKPLDIITFKPIGLEEFKQYEH
ncbi:5-oxoprolinase subunit PxpB [Kangiella shandongensis]|uniref:5-oxoprolinase subunit PxpB n=1 Tax=Kangiella shandongensis TaxID=2763258 RepID=UPI001CBE61E4|nr:5-oxoprolinase subunit PxpB [Kangiella shandongensis]